MTTRRDFLKAFAATVQRLGSPRDWVGPVERNVVWRTVGSGTWDDPYVWSQGRMPDETASEIHIGVGHTLVIPRGLQCYWLEA